MTAPDGRWSYEPAADLGTGPAQRLRSVRREPGLFSAVVHAVWWGAIRLSLGLVHRLHVEGREHLPRAAPFVLVANHSSHLDALVLAAVLPASLRRDAYPIAAGDTFFRSSASALFAALALNALPMWRRNAGRHALSDLRARLHAGRSVFILFPEGTRSRDGAMAAFKPGIGMLIAASDVPVVPCAIHGASEAWPPHHRLPRPRRIRVRIGAPRGFLHEPNTRAGWQNIAGALESDIRALHATLM